MHSIKDLENHFGLSYWQTRKRIGLISNYFESEVKGGQNSKYWLTDSGLAILDRMLELEKDGHGPKSAIEAIKEEIQKPDMESDNLKSKQAKVDPKYVQRLESEVEFLREELKERDRQIRQLLPGSAKKGIMRRIWERIW